MSKFVKKGGGDTPSISTASLPDIIFMILMFFMVSVSMRQTDRKVIVSLPGEMCIRDSPYGVRTYQRI